MTHSEQERYHLEKPLGSGAMGEVWLATDTLLNRPVAIKYLKATHDVVQREFFLSEARALASLNHPNISLIYDAVFDETRNSFYLVMEYVEGKSLSTLMAEWSGPLPLEITLDVTTDILQALQYAHGKGIVHRDIKPENVIMQKEGVKLTDFGLAGLMSLLAAGSEYVVGTPAYMAPEQIAGQAVDGRTDLYALGAMLFEMASGGYQPFPYARQTELFEAHLREDPQPLEQFVPNIPVALQQIIRRLLAKEPEDRYPSAGVALDVISSLQSRLKYSRLPFNLFDPEARPLVGRSAELKQIDAAWIESRQSARPHLLVIEGESGIGKSSLAAEFLIRDVIDKGFVALVGRGDDTGLPYAPFAEIVATIINRGLAKNITTMHQIDQLVAQVPGLARLLNLPGPSEEEEARPQAPVSLGLWKTLSGRVPAGIAEDPQPAQWQFFATILTILAELGPTVIFLEDATMLDEASMALIQFLIQQGQLPLLFVAACRPAKAPPAWFDAIPADEKTVISLLPLPDTAVRECITHLVNGPVAEEAGKLILEQSQGNPGRIEEITRHLVDSQLLQREREDQPWRYVPDQAPELEFDAFLPKTVLRAFTRKIEQLSPEDRLALAMAALIEPGAEFDYSTWVALLGGESQRNEALAVLNQGLQKRLLRQIGHNRYTFRPPDVAQALIANFSEAQRSNAHGQIARLLGQQGADPVLVSYHYERAGQLTEAANYLEVAGARALAANAICTAIEYYNRAASLVESRSAYKALGYLHRRDGKRIDSVQAFQRALTLAEQAGDTADQARILNGIALTLWLYDYYKEAYRHAAAVLKLAEISDVDRAAAQSHLGAISWLVGRLDEAEAWCRKSLETSLQSGQEGGVAEANYRLGLIYLSRGKFAEAETHFQHSLNLQQNLGDERGQAHCMIGLGKAATEQGDFWQAQSFFNSAQLLSEKVRDREGLIRVYAERGRTMIHKGQGGNALPWLRKALHMATETGRYSSRILGDIYLLVARVNLANGQIDRARAAAEEALRHALAIGNKESIAQGRATMAQILAVQNDVISAETTFQETISLFEQIGSQAGLLRTKLNYAWFLKQQGDTAGATTLEMEVRREAHKIGLYLPAT